MRLDVKVGETVWPIDCDPASAPRTLDALSGLLPLPVRFQTPKIAGSHLYWQVPLLCDLEAAADIMALAPGTFLYWPERQFLEILFASLQQETAAVTVLGRLAEPSQVPAVADFGTRLRETAGTGVLEGSLHRVDAPARTLPPTPPPPGLSGLRADRDAVWAACPDEIRNLLADRGILHPAGPALFAESEARSLHEQLWWLRRDGDAPAVRAAAAVLLRKAAARLSGFCHLTEAGTVLDRAAGLFADEALPVGPTLDESILYLGGLSAWLDLKIPWNALNEAFRAAAPAPLKETSS